MMSTDQPPQHEAGLQVRPATNDDYDALCPLFAELDLFHRLARQYAAQGVTFNSLAPGAIATDRNAAVLADAEYRARVEAQVPARRIGTPMDCVGACLLLCSDAGAYITGSTIYVDGAAGTRPSTRVGPGSRRRRAGSRRRCARS